MGVERREREKIRRKDEKEVGKGTICSVMESAFCLKQRDWELDLAVKDVGILQMPEELKVSSGPGKLFQRHLLCRTLLQDHPHPTPTPPIHSPTSP